MEEHELARIREAYDLTVVQHGEGADPMDAVPEEFRESEACKALMREAGPSSTGSMKRLGYLMLSRYMRIAFVWGSSDRYSRTSLSSTSSLLPSPMTLAIPKCSPVMIYRMV